MFKVFTCDAQIMSYYMHEVKGVSANLLNHWINAKFAEGKKQELGRIWLARKCIGEGPGLLTLGQGPVRW